MTLIVAASNGSVIAVGSDTRSYESDRVGNISRYMTVPDPKIRRYGNFVVGISGQSSAKNVIDYILATDPIPSDDIHIAVMELISKMGAVYQERRIEINSSVLLAGFDLQGKPYLASWTANNPSDLSDAPDKKAIGCACGVALHFPARADLKSVPDDDLPSLVYFSIAEVCHYETRVAKPIDMAVITGKSCTVLDRADACIRWEAQSENIASGLYERFKRKAQTR
jgi:hypothetical protein